MTVATSGFAGIWIILIRVRMMKRIMASLLWFLASEVSPQITYSSSAPAKALAFVPVPPKAP